MGSFGALQHWMTRLDWEMERKLENVLLLKATRDVISLETI